MEKIFDTHAHYDDEKYNDDREEVLDKIYKSGVTKCINVGCSIETTKNSIELANNYKFIYAICGIHPSEIAETEEAMIKDIEKIKELVQQSKKVVDNKKV